MIANVRFPLSRLAHTQRRLARDTSGLALLEFALSMPLVLMIGLYGIETANQALINLKISQIALNLADNASRVGLINGSTSVEQLREIDMNDVLQAARNQGDSIDLTTRGRITVSSLENVGGVQRIHWQRCLGVKSGVGYDSTYGISSTATNSDTGTYDPNAGVNTATLPADNSASRLGSVAVGGTNGVKLSGMGDDATSAVTAPANGGVIFVEINYDYKPVVGAWLFGAAKIHYTASFIVRDNRLFGQIYNPSPTATRSTCDLHTT